MLGKVVGFIPTRDAELARQFYSEILGLKFIADEPYALVYDSGGIMIRIQKVADFTPAENTLFGWEVVNIERVVRLLLQRGVTFLRFAGLEQDGLGIWNTPSRVRVAWFKDPDGNNLSLIER
jgi:catechol 2,3-dioxygenase-like lactoylglutathione lyase family enzyme